MFMLGTIVNAAAIAVCAVIGVLLKKGIPERITKTVTAGVALCVVFIGITGAIGGYAEFTEGNTLFRDYGMLFIILSVALGALIGELLDIDRALEALGAWVERKPSHKGGEGGGPSLSTGFVNCTLLFCVGSMAILGAIEDTGTGTPDILFSKAVLDGISALVMATSMGVGCVLSAVSVLLYQGLFSLLALLFLSGVPAAVMGALSCSGSLVIVAIGTNMLGMTRIKTANLIPAVFLPLLTALLL